MRALGMVETVGYSTAVFAADAGLKAAEVKLHSIERVIGVAGSLGVSIQFEGDVAAVDSAVQAAKEAGERVGTVVSVLVIPRVHEEVSHEILPLFEVIQSEVHSDDGGDQEVGEGAVDDPSASDRGTHTAGKLGESSTKRRTKHE